MSRVSVQCHTILPLTPSPSSLLLSLFHGTMSVENEKTDVTSARKGSISTDVEAEIVTVNYVENGLKRQMKNRHIAMIRYVLSIHGSMSVAECSPLYSIGGE